MYFECFLLLNILIIFLFSESFCSCCFSHYFHRYMCIYTLKKLDNDQSFLFKQNNTLFLLIKQYLLTKYISNLNQTDLYFCKEIKLRML